MDMDIDGSVSIMATPKKITVRKRSKITTNTKIILYRKCYCWWVEMSSWYDLVLNLCWHIDVDHRIRLLPICQSCRTTKLSFSRNIYLHFLDILIQLSLPYIQQSWIFDAHSLRHYKIVDILFWMKMYPFYTNLGQSFMNQVHPIQENPFLGQDDPNSCWKKCEDESKSGCYVWPIKTKKNYV